MTLPSSLVAITAALIVGTGAAGAALADEGRGHGPGSRIDFQALDADGDGAVSQAELSARATERLAELDADGDGALERDEIIAGMPGPRGALHNPFGADPAAARADRMLAFMGATESGRFTIADLAERQVDGLLARLDEDRDGVISAEEAEAMQARFAERRHGWHGWHDRDGDGSPRDRN